ncbi:hypothetical protein HYW42_05630 [Candidatus Daviesbacteria bacterium]|nr:hypothetical protein [Candidatus Daviesbacteria bacterium]
MIIKPERIEQYKETYLKQYGLELSDKEATSQLLNLMELVKTVYGDNVIRIVSIDNQNQRCE